VCAVSRTSVCELPIAKPEGNYGLLPGRKSCLRGTMLAMDWKNKRAILVGIVNTYFFSLHLLLDYECVEFYAFCAYQTAIFPNTCTTKTITTACST
jgi:hypothetical protein